MTRVRSLLAAVAALLIAAPAMAEDAKAGEDSVKQLLEVMKVSRIVDNYVAQIDTTVRSQMQQALSAASLSPAQQKVIDTLGGKVMAATQKQINWAQVEPQLVEAYRNTFRSARSTACSITTARPPVRRSLPSSRACSSKACSSCSSG